MKQKWFIKNSRLFLPSAWQGFAIVIIVIVLNIKAFIVIDNHSHSVSDTLIGFLPCFLLSLYLLYIIGKKKS